MGRLRSRILRFALRHRARMLCPTGKCRLAGIDAPRMCINVSEEELLAELAMLRKQTGMEWTHGHEDYFR